MEKNILCNEQSKSYIIYKRVEDLLLTYRHKTLRTDARIINHMLAEKVISLTNFSELPYV